MKAWRWSMPNDVKSPSIWRGLSQTFLDRYANCAGTQHGLTFGCGFGFHPVKFLFQVETTWARQSAITPKTAREKTLRQAPYGYNHGSRITAAKPRNPSGAGRPLDHSLDVRSRARMLTARTSSKGR